MASEVETSLGSKVWISQKVRDKYLALYGRFCETCDVECPTFETWLIMFIETQTVLGILMNPLGI